MNIVSLQLEAKDQENANLANTLTEEIESIWNRLQFSEAELEKPLPVSGHKPSDLKIVSISKLVLL